MCGEPGTKLTATSHEAIVEQLAALCNDGVVIARMGTILYICASLRLLVMLLMDDAQLHFIVKAC